jgi:hypothetical protein
MTKEEQVGTRWFAGLGAKGRHVVSLTFYGC